MIAGRLCLFCDLAVLLLLACGYLAFADSKAGRIAIFACGAQLTGMLWIYGKPLLVLHLWSLLGSFLRTSVDGVVATALVACVALAAPTLCMSGALKCIMARADDPAVGGATGASP